MSSLYGCACARNLYESITQQQNHHSLSLSHTHTHTHTYRYPGAVYKGTNNNVIRERKGTTTPATDGIWWILLCFARIAMNLILTFSGRQQRWKQNNTQATAAKGNFILNAYVDKELLFLHRYMSSVGQSRKEVKLRMRISRSKINLCLTFTEQKTTTRDPLIRLSAGWRSLIRKGHWTQDAADIIGSLYIDII